MYAHCRLVGLGSSSAIARMLLPLLALSAAGCGSEDAPTGPTASAPGLAAAVTPPSYVQIAIGGVPMPFRSHAQRRKFAQPEDHLIAGRGAANQ